MAEIKRLNYFTGEFLIEEDFTAEQKYHMDMRRHHNRVFHGFGVVEGLDVVLTGDRTVRVTAGTALDAQGREMVLVNDVTYTFEGTFPLHLTIAYEEVHDDPADRSPQEGIDNFIRWTERPRLQESPTLPTGGSAIVLALVDPQDRNSDGVTVDTSMVPRAAVSSVAPGVIHREQLANNSVTPDKLAPRSVGINALAITEADDGPQTLEANTQGEYSISIDSPLPQFLFVSVMPTTPNGTLSFTQQVTRGGSSANDRVTFTVTVTNPTAADVSFRLVMKTLALA